MKKLIHPLNLHGILVILTLVITTVSCLSNEDKTPTIEKKFTADIPGNLFVRTSGGGISVYGMDGSTVEVKAYIRKNGSLISPDDPDLEKILQGFELTIEQIGKDIHAEARKTENGFPWKNISVSFHVNVPHDMSCDLNTSGGGIKLCGVNGRQKINTSGGGIKLSDINGNTNAETSGGGIHVENIEGETYVNTSGGGITIENGKGNIKANTSGGSIKLNNILGDIDAHTSGGGIKISGEAGYVKATTSGGGINVDITGLNKELYLDTSGGGIDVSMPGGLGMDLNLKANKVNVDLKNYSGNFKEGHINGTMNGGGIPVYMHTSGGNIDIDFK